MKNTFTLICAILTSGLIFAQGKKTSQTDLMRSFYKEVSKKLDTLDFEKIYPGFHRFPFALYNDKTIWLEDREIPQQGFFGNTAIEFEGQLIAIWNVTEDTDSIDLDTFTANMVHEMFHAFQKEK